MIMQNFTIYKSHNTAYKYRLNTVFITANHIFIEVFQAVFLWNEDRSFVCFT